MNPLMIYGTAWKEERTTELTKNAVRAGFRAIDTANQKKHYREDLVGVALRELADQGIPRAELFLQSKFTYVNGQDHRLPYDPADSFSQQVRSSFASTLENLGTTYLDSYLIHGPSSYPHLSDADWEVWTVLEDLLDKKQTLAIGISNVGIHQLHELCQGAKIKPKYVQNRCFANQGWDEDVREYCLAHDITYQGFSLLTANPRFCAAPALHKIAEHRNRTPAQIVFRYCQQIGILPLTGTTDQTHMNEDLRVNDFELSSEETQILAKIY